VNRRTWLAGGVAVAAAAAGLGWQLWRGQRRAAAEEALHAATGGLWTLRFPQPGGGELAMATLRGRPLLLNFWATWCPPCLREMPALDRVQREFAARGLAVVGLAIDGATPVRDYLARTPVSYAIGLAGFEGTELSRRLGNDRGALPFSVLFGTDGLVRERKLGEASEDELRAWARIVA
jgi:thiol-disulfide isomerase/thioredoxin